jgi:Transmembrane family 220, helix
LQSSRIKTVYFASKIAHMKIAFWVLAVVFALFAAVQYNDPDPLSWILLYGAVAVHFALAALGKMNRLAVWLTLAAAVIWAAALFPDFLNWIRMGEPSIVETMKAEEPWIELTREFLGLVIVALGCGFLLWKKR